MIRSYSVRLVATKRQAVLLTGLLSHLCELYNAALQERRDAWKVCRKRIGLYDQQVELTQLRAIDPESAGYPVAIQRDPLRRVKRAFDGFFRRVRKGQEPGYPRFRSRERYDSFSVEFGRFRLEGDALLIAGIGGFGIRTRCRIKGIPKVLHVKRHGSKWRAVIACEIGPAPERKTVSRAIGIDVGLTTLAVLSDGSEIHNPQWTRNSEVALARSNRNLARKKRGSKNRCKAIEGLRRVHQSIRGSRRSYLHAVSQFLVGNFDLIAYEKLSIRGMARGHFAKSIMDAAWGELIWQLKYKAEKAGVWVVPVDAKGTTQLCSGCGTKVPKDIEQRRHECPSCGLSLGRDHNAALNVLQRGLRCVGRPAGVQYEHSRSRKDGFSR